MIPGLGLILFLFYFFRDPERIPPPDTSLLVCPADGRVVSVKHNENGHWVSIFMSLFDVHVNRAPCDGVVERIVHNPGRFKAAYLDEASFENENTEITLSTPFGQILIRQVAGVLARRIVCRVKEGDTLRRAERFGLIMLGSRVDVRLPSQIQILVKEGMQVKAGETPLAIVNLNTGDLHLEVPG